MTPTLTPLAKRLRNGHRWVFIDFEFIERVDPLYPFTVDLVSVGAVDVDNPTDCYYAVADDIDLDTLLARPWLRDNVAPSLPWKQAEHDDQKLTPDRFDRGHHTVMPRVVIAHKLTHFLRGDGRPLRIWADCRGYDHVLLNWLWGGMHARPTGFEYYTNELRQHLWTHGVDIETVPRQHGGLHHALADAQHGARVLRFVDDVLQFRDGLTTRPTRAAHDPGF